MFEIIDKNYIFDNNCTYKIVYSIDLNDKKVYYLINVNDFSDIKFCYSYDEEFFEEIRNIEELKVIIEEMGRGAAIFIK